MSEQPDIQILADVPRWHARVRGDSVAFVFEDRETTWSQFDGGTSQVANALLGEGIKRGSRVAFVGKDSDLVYEGIFGCAKARAVVMGINWRLAAPEIEFILGDGEAELLFVGEDCFETVEQISSDLRKVRQIITTSGRHPKWPTYEEWRDARGGADPGLESDPEDVAIQMYTSGTTGRPKGVQLANRSFFAVVRSMAAHGDSWIGWTPEDVSLHAFPSFHIGGLWWAVTGLAAGARNILVDSFVAWKTLELIERHRVTKTCMVPAMIQMMLAEPSCGETDFSSLQHVVYGGSPIPVPLLQEAMSTLRCGFAQIYGLTETGNTAVCLRPEDHVIDDPVRLRAAGRPYPGVEIKCLDRAGQRLPAGMVGEICIKSPANMVGYWKRPEATASTLIDGWIHTGDAGHVDHEGFVFVSDRVKDMIIYAGENIYPAEVESAISGHPAVAETAVIGVPDDRWGELVKAIVVLKPDCEASAAAIIAHTRTQLADFKVPRSVDFVPSLPRTPSGKVRKGELREPYWRGRERQV